MREPWYGHRYATPTMSELIRVGNKIQREALEAAAEAVDLFLRTDRYAAPKNIPYLIRAIIPNEPETKTVAVPAGQGYEAPVAGVAQMIHERKGET